MDDCSILPAGMIEWITLKRGSEFTSGLKFKKIIKKHTN